MNPQDIHAALIKELGLEGMPKDVQDEAVAVIGGPILQSVTLALLEKLPPQAQTDFQSALEAADAMRIEAVLQAHIPDSSSFIETEVQKAIAEFKSLAGK